METILDLKIQRKLLPIQLENVLYNMISKNMFYITLKKFQRNRNFKRRNWKKFSIFFNNKKIFFSVENILSNLCYNYR